MAEYTREMQVASFLSRVNIAGERDCWLWKGCTYNCGYGSFKWRGKMRGANRVAWEIAHGKEIPDGMDVCHTCDVRLCVNPAHLFLGTHQDNMIDMHRKMRCPTVSLKPDQVREVRKLLLEGTLFQYEIAEKFGVTKGVINGINVGRSYRHVKDEATA